MPEGRLRDRAHTLVQNWGQGWGLDQKQRLCARGRGPGAPQRARLLGPP